MMVALLDSAILRNLHLGRTTLYDLCDEDDEALPVIIAVGQPASVFRHFPLAARLAEFGRLSVPAGRCANSRSGRRIPDKHA
jgi:hypothetical protein